MKKVLSLLMVLSLVYTMLFSTNMRVSASGVGLADDYSERMNEFDNLTLEDEMDPVLTVTPYALPLIAPVIVFLLKQGAKKAVKEYGKQVVIDAVMKELGLPKTISGKNLVKKLKKVGFKQVRQSGSHVTMKGLNGKTFTVPMHPTIKKGTYEAIKKSIKNSIAP